MVNANFGPTPLTLINARNITRSGCNAKQEAISALCALGYKPQDASKMVQGIAQEDKSCEDIIRLALQGKTT
jgi:Holliday junction DNA helicase RuvA